MNEELRKLLDDLQWAVGQMEVWVKELRKHWDLTKANEMTRNVSPSLPETRRDGQEVEAILKKYTTNDNAKNVRQIVDDALLKMNTIALMTSMAAVYEAVNQIDVASEQLQIFINEIRAANA